MSFVDSKDGSKVSIVCDHKGCTNKVTGTLRGETWRKAKDAGWRVPNAREHYCPTHKVEHGARVPKAEKANGKSKKVAKPAKKGSGKLSATGKVWSYSPKTKSVEPVGE